MLRWIRKPYGLKTVLQRVNAKLYSVPVENTFEQQPVVEEGTFHWMALFRVAFAECRNRRSEEILLLLEWYVDYRTSLGIGLR